MGRSEKYELLIHALALLLLFAVVGLSLYIQYLYGHYESYREFIATGRFYIILALLEIAAGTWAIFGRSLPFLLSSSALLMVGIISEDRDAGLALTLSFSALFISYFELAHLSLKLTYTEKEGRENLPYVVRTYLRSLAVLVLLAVVSVLISLKIHRYIASYGIAMLLTVYGFMVASAALFLMLLGLRYIIKAYMER